MKNRIGFFEKLFFNNKFVLVFSLLIAIVSWAFVKYNYSEQVTKVITGVNISFDTTFNEETDYIPFYDSKELVADVTVTGKSYDINSSTLTKNSISVVATVGFTDAAGYKELNLSATTSESGVAISKIEPSTIKVFFDRKITGSFNVEANLKNELSSLSKGEYVVGQPAASLSTVEVSGPATVLAKLKKVYFNAKVNDEDIPLTSTTELSANVSYDIADDENVKYLVCAAAKDKSNPATITIPVYKERIVPTVVKFINEPAIYEKIPPNITISPSKVKITYNPLDSDDITSYNIGTIDFRKLKNEVNKIDFKVDKNSGVTLADSSITDFNVTIDLSELEQIELEGMAEKIVFLNQTQGYTYSADFLSAGGLDKITIIGPKNSLEKIKPEDLQIEINVSDIDTRKSARKTLEVSNISIQSKDINDCWVYGTYTATVTATNTSSKQRQN